MDVPLAPLIRFLGSGSFYQTFNQSDDPHSRLGEKSVKADLPPEERPRLPGQHCVIIGIFAQVVAFS